MPSITRWIRLEPSARDDSLRAGMQARIHDPLWLLARQWQLGEFRAEDTGSPVSARLRAEQSRITRYHPGPCPDGATVKGQSYDSQHVPLETLVEREPVRTQRGDQANRRLAAEAGLQFLRRLKHKRLSRHARAYIEQYAFALPSDAQREHYDNDSLRFLKLIARRVPDGDRLYADLRKSLRPRGSTKPGLPKLPAIRPAADKKKIMDIAVAWLDWYDAQLSEPDKPDSPWVAERMEYEFALAAPSASGEVVLSSPEYTEGHLDWYAFNRRADVSLGVTRQDPVPQSMTRTVIPAPVSYAGMPASRWWEFENAKVNLDAVQADPEDLARLLLVEYSLVFANDWFVMPVELDVGSVCRIQSLVVTDTFGQRQLIRPYHEVDGPDAPWRMYSPAPDPRVSKKSAQSVEPDVFFLPPVLGTGLQGKPIEEVVFMRDEMANLAWALEANVESPSGGVVDRRQAPRPLDPEAESAGPDAASESERAWRYRLMNRVPECWIPLMPVRQDDGISVVLRRARMLNDQSAQAIAPRGQILQPDQALSLLEEEVPRAGARVTRAYQYTRWIDGSTHVWIGRRKTVGRGQGSSGLQFDLVKPF